MIETQAQTASKDRLNQVYRRVRWMYPKGLLTWLDKALIFAGLDAETQTVVSLMFLYSLGVGLTAFSLVLILGYGGAIGGLASVLGFVGGIFAMHGLICLIIMMIGDSRGGFAESVLPDALQLMAANIRSGLTPDKALLFAARPEFGILEHEIKLAASKAMVGEPIEEALTNLGVRIKSRIINRTFTLIVEGMKKGGEIASLLEQTANDIRDLKMLKKEIATQVSMYASFIFIAVAFAAPMLFAFSSHMVTTMSAIGSKINVGDAQKYAGVGSIKFGAVMISSEFLQMFTLSVLTLSSVFGGLIVGLLLDGKEKAGIKYIPILFLCNVTVYFGIKIVLASVLGIGDAGSISAF
jgi:archaeal flagellar protein FlaJ